MQKDTAYELEVEIDKDYSNFKKDIESISDFIKRNENYEEAFQKVSLLFLKEIISYS